MRQYYARDGHADIVTNGTRFGTVNGYRIQRNICASRNVLGEMTAVRFQEWHGLPLVGRKSRLDARSPAQEARAPATTRRMAHDMGCALRDPLS